MLNMFFPITLLNKPVRFFMFIKFMKLYDRKIEICYVQRHGNFFFLSCLIYCMRIRSFMVNEFLSCKTNHHRRSSY